jgi:hypothetical protein
MTLLRLWFLLTVLIVGGWFIYAFVPVLIPFIVIAIGLGCLTILIVAAARRLERRRKP